MRILTMAAVLALAAPGLSGCAGGWRNGAPPGAEPAAAKARATGTAAAANSSKGPAAGADGVTFRYEGTAQTVALAGEFNGWSTTADPLTKGADGTWTITKDLAPGRYPYKFVIDGTTWKEDPNAAETVDDGYGGKNSLVVVGEGGKAAPAAAPKAQAPAGAAVRAPGAGGVTFQYSGPGSSVALAGEFNGWSTTADPLTKGADGTWTITKNLAPGRYPYKFVIDGTTWKEDPNAAESVDDGYGGKNSLVVVGEGAGGAAGGTAAAAGGEANGGGAEGRAPEITPDGVRFYFPGSHRSVALAGDFNAWSTTADPMKVGPDGLWTILKPLEPGTYGYKFVVDGTTWKTDEANPEAVDDGFGGKNSVITVK